MINQKGGLNQEVLRQFSLAKMNQTPGNQGSYALQVIILGQIQTAVFHNFKLKKNNLFFYIFQVMNQLTNHIMTENVKTSQLPHTPR